MFGFQAAAGRGDAPAPRAAAPKTLRRAKDQAPMTRPRDAAQTAPAPEFSRPLRVRDLGPGAEKVSASATAEERAALARRFGVESVEALRFVADVTPAGEGWRVAGVAEARLTQTCVVTLEPVAQHLEESFARRFVPEAGDPESVAIDPDEEEDPPEPLGRVLDPAEMAAEAVALAIDPYPRAPGARFESEAAAPADAEEAPVNRPFAKLAALRDRLARDEE
jgi:uncharacterized metal-binding protein YceD (DUF177 family)